MAAIAADPDTQRWWTLTDPCHPLPGATTGEAAPACPVLREQGSRALPHLGHGRRHIREGVRINCVNPGTVDTPWVSRLLHAADDPAAEHAALDARQPHGRLVTAEEVAAAVAYLASPLAGSTTGTALPVDGGTAGVRLRPIPG